MAADGIQITLGELTQVAGNIRSLNTSLTACLEECRSTMNALAQDWSSESSETIRAKFNAHAAHFEEYRNVIDSYAKFLDSTASAYEATENSINSNANLFK
ncbi:MAG: WXG100 family type VII secretion target [Lachnospiraceae bacterium]|nr:WXG100 family type VII secretion target [Lachnospiraceae bacterium]